MNSGQHSEFNVISIKQTTGVETTAKVLQTTSEDFVKLIFLDSSGLDLYHGLLMNYVRPHQL
jgi:hypothetical protein